VDEFRLDGYWMNPNKIETKDGQFWAKLELCMTKKLINQLDTPTTNTDGCCTRPS
jgi:hypothetical protein